MSFSLPQLEQEVDTKFRQFADSLKADDEYHDEGIRLCEKIHRFLKQKTIFKSFSIHSALNGGSTGYKTNIKTDFDIIMKITNRRPPFKDVLAFFEVELKKNATSFNINRETFTRTQIFLQFAFIDGRKVDLIPIVSNLTLEEAFREQKWQNRCCRYYSSTLLDNRFMKKQSAFAHAMARVARYWYKNMDLGDDFVSAGCTVFELLGVATTMEKPEEGESILQF